jgi:glycolate oxidase iron-sulfur subunit
VRDVSELLAPVAAGGSGGGTPAAGSLQGTARTRVAYDAPCHLQHGQRVVEPPLALLRALPEIQLVPLADSDQCCGSAGIFSLVRPAVAGAVLAPKLARIRESGAAVVATGNPGCLMQIGGGLLREGTGTVARHPVELLDGHYARVSAGR